MSKIPPKLILLLSLFMSSEVCFSQAITEQSYLDVSISLFDMNLPEDERIQKLQNIYPQVRNAEARYMPALLRATMQQTNQWGAIRIIPEPNESAELMILSSIIKSDGLELELAITATDSTGKQWLKQNYSNLAETSISLNTLSTSDLALDPFQEVYNRISADLLKIYQLLSEQNITQIKNMSFLRYGEDLSPQSFAPYIQVNEAGLYQYTSLPASNDPMNLRIKEIREHEYLFIDVVDQNYQEFLVTIKPIYDLWRSYIKELVQDDLDYQVRQNGEREFRRGSYRALKESYDNFRWEKMQAQYLDQLSEGFSNEVSSTEINLNDTVYELSGTLENQYWEWREILRSLVELETTQF